MNYFSIKPCVRDGGCTGCTITFTTPILEGGKDTLPKGEAVVEVTDDKVAIVSGEEEDYVKELVSQFVATPQDFQNLAKDAIENAHKVRITSGNIK
jgi:Fe-S cluster assembly iron-binding protein IscA